MDALRFGRQFRALRVRMARRQVDVAADARLSRSLVAAIDRGERAGVTVGSLVKAAAALGADVDIHLRWRGERLDRLVDEAHAALVESMVQLLRGVGWTTEVEVSFSVWGERGSIDVLAFHPIDGALLVVEVKSVVPDSQATLHALDRKARLARDLSKGRGWEVRHVSRLLVIGATATSRRRVARLEATYDAALPERGITVRHWIRQPDRRLAGLLFLAYASHDGPRRTEPFRDRVRRSKRVQSTARTAIERDPGAVDAKAVARANVTVK